MNRREFVSVLGGTAALTFAKVPSLWAGNTTSLYLKGLVMMSFEDGEYLRIGFPDAPKHKATMTIVPEKGKNRRVEIKGKGMLQAAANASGKPRIVMPELVRMKEFYGETVRSQNFESCPSLISIPYASIVSVTTHNVSEERYTFVRSDTGQEIDSFRPRQVADTIRIELSCPGVLKLNGGKVTIPLESTREMRTVYTTNGAVPGGWVEHFAHYLAYVEKPTAAQFDVVPKKLAGSTTSAPTPKIGNSYMMVYPDFFCYVIGID